MNTDTKKQLEALQERYANGLPAMIDALEETWSAVCAERQNPDKLRDFHRRVHTLAGSGKTFGYSAVSAGAQGIERIIEDALMHCAFLGAGDVRRVARLIDLLRRASLRNPVQDAGASDSKDGLYRALTQRKTILVVDDDPNFRSMLKIKLEAIGFRIISAFDGIEGYEKVLSKTPDLIITDHIMPNANSDYMLSKIRGNISTEDIPAIVITSQKLHGRKDYALERELTGRHSALACLEKPLDFDSLLRQIARALPIDTQQ